MEQLQAAVSLSLRETEVCVAAAEVQELPIRQDEHLTNNRRVLAVVVHKPIVSQRKGNEEGCLFVLKYRSSSSSELYPYLLFPIDGDLRASLKQGKGVDSSAFEISLKIPRGNVLLGSNEMHTLSAVLEETRRLKKHNGQTTLLLSAREEAFEESDTLFPEINISSNSSKDQEGEEKYWEWLHFYLSHRSSRILPSQRPKPPDIRLVVNGPILSSSSAGLLKDEDDDIALIRDQWVRKQLSLRRNEYNQRRALRLRTGTFNVNGKPPTQSLVPWIWGTTSAVDPDSEARLSSESEGKDLPPWVATNKTASSMTGSEASETSSDGTSTATPGMQASGPTSTISSPSSSIFPDSHRDLPDLFVLGFQELDLSTEALVYSTSTIKADAWVAAIFSALGKNAVHYTKLASRQLVGVLMVVIIRKELRSVVKEICTGSAGVGLMGIMGNKGATAIRLRLNSTIVTFVCSHLAAFDDYVDKRNSDFSELARKLDFTIAWKGARNTRPVRANIWETDILFWIVDLNYRIDLPDEEVRTFLSSEPHGHENQTLLEYDQLRMSMRRQRAFIDFKEHDINFLPTYRFADEQTRDNLGYDTKRRPAWTDRILHLSADWNSVSQKSYDSHPQITMSDHHPVSADFELFVDDHDPHKYHQVATSVFKKLGDFEDSGEALTVTVLDGVEIDMGSVSYLQPISRAVRIQNNGKVTCAFRFIPLDPGSPIHKEWLGLEPLNGILLPGEIQTINITIKINKRAASFLNHGNTRLEDSLILRFVKGTDILLTVSGSYLPTCFSNSLAWLVRSSGPIRTQGDAQLLPEANTLSAPRELMFLVEWLITNAQDVHDLFVDSADESLVFIIREHLDTQPLDTSKGVSFPEGADSRSIALAFGDALLQFLDSLTEPVIPWVLHPRCALAKDREDVFEILDDVPSFARNVYITVTAFLHFISQLGDPERPKDLARIFANILLRDNPRPPLGHPDLTPLGKRNFLLHTIS
ncbi:DNase I-like protein [Ramaria rubella]|nr:DNase I-like protein [Ramaria rubella]